MTPDPVPSQTPAYLEDDLSQIPAVLLLQNLGYEYLTPTEARKLRGGRESQVLLVDVLAEQLRKINRVRYRGEDLPFTEAAIAEAIRLLRDIDQGSGLLRTNLAVWDLLRLGTAQEQTIQGDKKSFTLRYVDWDIPANNRFHVTEEFAVTRQDGDGTLVPDLVLFCNGIPFAVIECKRPGIKKPLEQAISQHIRNQKDGAIPALYHHAQVLLGLAVDEASYATVGTSAKFWGQWKERAWPESEILDLVNRPAPSGVKDSVFGWREFGSTERDYLVHLESQGGRGLTEQDRLLWALCRPPRLLELADRYTVFDAGERKLARYQQLRCVEKAMARLRQRDAEGKRLGGIVWHTQGSGKSLTMVMLAEAILRDPSIHEPKIVLVTDRIDLDDQIYGTFKNCGAELAQATTGQGLLDLLGDGRTRIVTTLIHKFQTAIEGSRGIRIERDNVFVLVDESHRTNFGSLHAAMNRVLPNACLIGFTGTPVLKRDRNVLLKFGGFIDTYTIDEAVADKAVVPLLYEGRHVLQSVDDKVIDAWFERVVQDLSPEQRRDLKTRFATRNQLNRTEQKIMAVAWDLHEHYRQNWQGTGFKAQLTAPSKADALLYQRCFEQFGGVSSAVLISPPDQREGHDEVDEIGDPSGRPDVNDFWTKMMKRFGIEEQYQKSLIAQFKVEGDPEILIVVDKLLTGFDAPRNTVLYVTRSLKEHGLLQAIARVNRLHEGKEFGFVVDYYGVLKKLGDALELYASFDGEYEAADIASAVQDVDAECQQLPQRHTDVWQCFAAVTNKHDREAMIGALAAAEDRERFYERLGRFARTMQVAMSSASFLEQAEPRKIARYREDLKYFVDLRVSVARRYAERIDFGQYQERIQKLLDVHVKSSDVKVLVEPVSIFDKEAFQREIDELDGDRSKALTIANRVKAAIHEHMAEDPAFYQRFSELLKQAIDEFHQQRLDDAAFLARVREIAANVRDRGGDDLPKELAGRDVARAYFGIARDGLGSKAGPAALAGLAIRIEAAIEALRIVRWTESVDRQNQMRTAIEDEMLAWAEEAGEQFPFEVIDRVMEGCLDVARVRLP